MRLSRYFLPTMKEVPSDAQVISHRLMLRAGLVRQLVAGQYNWLPLGRRVLKKVEEIVREEMDRAGCQEILMPTLQPLSLWEESGRQDAYGPELLRTEDRHGRTLVYGPTAEEVVTDIFRSEVRSYKELPKNLYNIQWKFRDEIRPRFGVMRGREFLMKDAYSFDLDYESATKSYYRMFVAYLRTFRRLGVKAVPVQADTGAVGGSLSHEFQVLAETGESELCCHKELLSLPTPDALDDDAEIAKVVDKWTAHYTAADEMRDPGKEEAMGEDAVVARGIEVGHIFYLGQKYSSALGATVVGADNKEATVEMGCYGIGVSRLVGAIIEASHDDDGIIWPEAVAPFKVGLINLKTGDEQTDAACEAIYKSLQDNGVDVLYDDRNERAGAKFKDMDLIGLPWQAVVGPRGLKYGVVELKNRATGEKEELPIDALLSKLQHNRRASSDFGDINKG